MSTNIIGPFDQDDFKTMQTLKASISTFREMNNRVAEDKVTKVLKYLMCK